MPLKTNLSCLFLYTILLPSTFLKAIGLLENTGTKLSAP